MTYVFGFCQCPGNDDVDADRDGDRFHSSLNIELGQTAYLCVRSIISYVAGADARFGFAF